MRWIWSLAFLLGCQAAGTTPVQPGDEKMVLGTIGPQADWVALADGQDATLVEGAQGGFHVWMKLKVLGVAPSTVTLVKEAHRLDDDAPVLRPPPGLLDVGDPGPDGAWEQPMPMPMFMCPSPIGVRVIDVPIVFSVALSDGDRPLARAQVTLVPRCPDGARAFCETICTG